MSSATATAAASALASRAAPHRGDHRRAEIATRRNAAAAKSRATTAAAAAETEKLPANLKKIVGAFQMVPDPMQRYKQLLFFAAKLKGFDEKDRVEDNKVQGCVSQVWVVPRMGEDGLVYFTADSDSQLTKGLAALLCEGLRRVLSHAGPHTTAFARCTPILEDFLSRRSSLSAQGPSVSIPDTPRCLSTPLLTPLNAAPTSL